MIRAGPMPFTLFILRNGHTPPIFSLIQSSKFRVFPFVTWVPPMFFLALHSVFTQFFPRKNYTPLYFFGVCARSAFYVVISHIGFTFLVNLNLLRDRLKHA